MLTYEKRYVRADHGYTAHVVSVDSADGYTRTLCGMKPTRTAKPWLREEPDTRWTSWYVFDCERCKKAHAKVTATAKPAAKVYKNRVAEVNAQLKAQGETPRLRAGRGYYYFDGDALAWPASSVYVCYADEMTVGEWMAEYGNLKQQAVAWGRA